MTEIQISEGNYDELEYNFESEKGDQIQVDKRDIEEQEWPKVRSRHVTQILGSAIALGLIFWAAYIVVSNKAMDSIDVLTFELSIATIICIAIAAHLRRTSSRS